MTSQNAMQAYSDHPAADGHEAPVHDPAQQREHLRHAIHHYAHMLSEQGPINITFVHNNTLLGLQAMHFEDAIAEAKRVLGADGYEPLEHYRRYHANGRIADKDLERSLLEREALESDRVIAQVGGRALRRRDVFLLDLVHGIDALDPTQLRQAALFEGAFERLRPGLAEATRKQVLEAARRELDEQVARIGKDRLLCDWVGALTGLPLRARLAERAAQLAGDAPDSLPETETSLGTLGIAAAARPGYLSCVDELFDGQHAAVGSTRDALRRVALAEEAALLRAICRRHWGVDGALPALRQHFATQIEKHAVAALWQASLRRLGEHDPFSLTDVDTLLARDPECDVAESEAQEASAAAEHARREYALGQLEADLAALGRGRTHADFLRGITGEALVETVNHHLVRLCSAFLDEGLAAWHMPGRDLGFYAAWRELVDKDWSFRLEGVEGWEQALEQLPSSADDALIQMLGRLGVDEAHWGEYLGRMLAQLKGWAGMVFWYEQHPTHYKQAVQPIDTVQYLAVRLFYEWMLVRQTCGERWGLDGHTESLRRHFTIHADEYLMRRELYAGHLSDGLAERARSLLGGARMPASALEALAAAVWAHVAHRVELERVGQGPWRLFHLAQHLGWTASVVDSLAPEELNALMQALDDLPDARKQAIWLVAYERHYRDEVLNALAQNVGRGRWAKGRTRRPRSQLVLCIDEREENLHRHYGELDPDHETLGAAGFFGVAQSFVALDDHDPTPLCPAVATPAHRVMEIPRVEALRAEYPVHKRRMKWKEVFDGSYWETKRNLVSSFFLIQLAGFFMALPLIGRVLSPRGYALAANAVDDAIIPPVRTRLTHVRIDEAEVHKMGLHTGGLPVGFAIHEAADRVEAQLRNWGLTYQFARIVVICAHRSYSVNNPHENAHDCGACGGKAGGPNARLFAALANDPQVRQTLRERGIDIPDDTWFVGAEHNTASDAILAFDTEDIPPSLRADWQLVKADLEETRRRAARERCRRFGSAPKDASLQASLKHVEGRSQDLSQVRPEWGHATNAFALVGRRCVTQGLFFDRRGFIISYDPTQDADGKILERILLAVGPVGAGINLEYYFSTVNPDLYGCGTKVPHNVTGMIGVMAGAHGDLQTGLPRQMTEVHEAMRLQLIVDAPLHILGEIYGRQPAIQQLLNGQWVHLVAHVPDTGELHLFVPGKGFVKWDEPLTPLPEVKDSYEWYRGKHECFLPPARIAEPTARWTERAEVH